MQMNPRSLGELTALRAHTKQLDTFFEKMARAGLKDMSPDDLVVRTTVTGIGATNDAALAPPAQAFGRVVMERSGFGKLLPLTVQTSPYFQVPVSLNDPPAAWVGEGHPIPVGRGSWARIVTAISHLATIYVVSKDLLRTTDPRIREMILRQSSRQLALALDLKFFGTDTATSSSPAGLLAAAPQFGGGSPADVGRDLSETFAYVSDGRPSAPVIVLSKRVALYLATLDEDIFRDVGVNGGNIAGIPVFTSPAAGRNIILIDADQIATYDGGVEVAPSEDAAVEMSDAPTNNAVTGAGAQLVSLFQTGAAGVRLTQTCDWRLLADDAVGFVALDELGGSPA